MHRRHLLQAAGTLPLTSLLTTRAAFAFEGAELYAGERALYDEAKKEGLCVSFDTGPEWANWKSLFRDFKKRYPEIELTYNDLGSAATVVALEKMRRRPQADTAYYFAASAVDAVKKDVVAPFKPLHFDKLPDVFRDAEGRWFTIHTLNIAFLVNRKLVRNVPAGWADLLKPEYKGLVGYLDPASAFVGYVGAVAANQARGGTLENFGPGIEYFKALQKNEPIVPKQTAYARVLSGEIAILLDYDFNAYRAKYKDGANVQFVIPAEGTVVVPYVMGMVASAPHAADAKKVLDFVLSDEGQAIWAKAYLRPVRAAAMPADVQARFLPAIEYQRAKTVDYGRMAAVQKAFSDRYLQDVK
ncbi:extracellular solute-binding protein [Paracidovorax cattleyae]|uniref:extracellular solute-binding protein n=1 Tax=Paracidovorax cattleyae TaxID=80868 RepID=UPI0018AF67D7|nr:extracellular solute-binding protein [Paracidovorax cattleyae]MBF9263501.1 extracellular solute-binding protein [Paracidovorax cattleyae]